MTHLGSLARSRDNNLNLIRMIAASAVLVSHAWPIDHGAGVEEPLKATLGHSLGTLAVYVFFAISGFLITASFERSANVGRFLAARALRLFPGLAVSLLLVALVLGPSVTTLPVGDYLGHTETWRFLVANLTLLVPQYTLPGVFETNPFPAVEGSIWTLIHEVACYLMVLCAGLCGLLRGRGRWVFIGLYALGWGLGLLFPSLLPQRVATLQSLSLPFFLGMLGWLWRDRLMVAFWPVVGLGLIWLALKATPLAYPAFSALVAYGIAWLAYVPGGILRRYNRLGDYSYGVYIYAFPIQGLIVWAFGSLGPLHHILLALPVTLVAAILSWHLVEKPALSLLSRRKN